ncbi:Zn-dependent alcohol dehydrogenase [Streptomyces sp. BH-SS-21]|uniref:Zn-dependent alcohol dehydrogenase n=1 Tax=Streptomyces liliiviolaceus TaxID=2823109 RepID=A0A940Y535_9ACTN|nr:Zn-dependent alcohol dehydrogenase [Streptomyces liliiviolaceus]MBQ0850749.1 Zn-dependent alcohol dehydrogenase [Streptomyces liliiviolaceus]
MSNRAAILWETRGEWTVEPVELADPGPGQILVKVKATGLCHSDDHAVTGDMPVPLPLVGGHEGAGIVEAVGPGVTRVAPGDHVVLIFNPPCGHCRNCGQGRSNLCLNAAQQGYGQQTPFSARGQSVAATGDLGTFADRTVVSERCAIKIDKDVPFAAASLLGCAVTTGWGAAVYLGEVGPGDNVVVVGSGGVGVNSVQGARNAGANLIVVVDPVEFKREQAKTFGATHAVASIAEATELLTELTPGRLADVAILSVGVSSGGLLAETVDLVGPGGIVVITSVTPAASTSLDLSLFQFTLTQKTLRGNVYGGVNVYRDVPLLVDLYRNKHLKLDELITSTYTLDDINQGYADLHSGKNLRGVVLLED